MTIEKRIIQRSIDIDDVLGLCVDKEANIMSKLRSLYERKCIDGCLVNKILKIVKCGDLELHKMGDPSKGTINVIFEVDAQVYHEGEIIVGCHLSIKSNSDQMILAGNGVNVLMPDDDLYRSITVGQIIPAVVRVSRYTIVNEVVSVSAMPFKLSMMAPITLYKTEWKNVDVRMLVKFLEPMMERVRNEITKCDEVRAKNASGWTFFENLLYPFVESRDVTAKPVNLLKVAAGEVELPSNVYMGYDTRSKVSSSDIVAVDKPETIQSKHVQVNVVDHYNGYDVVYLLLEKYHARMRLIREMIEAYPGDVFARHGNLWKIIKKSKAA